MGRFTRRLRLLVGFSQAELARRAGVSQAAISRLESGRALNTPMLVNMRIHLAMREGLGRLPPSLLSPELRLLMDMSAHVSAEAEPLADVVASYVQLPPARRVGALALLRLICEALAGADADGRQEGRVRRSAVHREGPRRREGPDLKAWMHRLGRLARELRVMAGLSQEEFARNAGVSQTALSRYERHAEATPMIVVMKVNAALRREVARGRLPTIDETRRLMALEVRGIPANASGFEDFRVTLSPDLESLTRLYWDVPPRQRARFAAIVRSLGDLTREPEPVVTRAVARRRAGRRRAR